MSRSAKTNTAGGGMHFRLLEVSIIMGLSAIEQRRGRLVEMHKKPRPIQAHWPKSLFPVREELTEKQMTNKTMPEILTIKEVVKLLSITQPTLRDLSRRSEDPLPMHMLSQKTPRVLRDELLAWVARQPQPHTTNLTP